MTREGTAMSGKVAKTIALAVVYLVAQLAALHWLAGDLIALP